MKLRMCLVATFLCLASSNAAADGLFIEAGPGWFRSTGAMLSLVRFDKDTSALFGQESFYEFSYASWDGKNRNRAVSIARGLRWKATPPFFWTFNGGISHVYNVTNNLGTSFQFYFRGSYGVKVGRADLSIGLIHYSNGKLLFGWNGPNDGENFATVSVGMIF